MSEPSPNSSAFWMPAGKLRRQQGRKVRADSVLKNLLRPAQELIVQWATCPVRDAENQDVPGTGCVAHALAQLAETAVQVSRPELAVSQATLYEFLDWFSLEEDLAISLAREEQVLANTGDRKKAREAGETVLMRLGIARRDPKLLTAAMMGEDSRRNLDLLEESGRTKAAQKNRALDQKDEAHRLAERKFQRDSCKLFLKWFDAEAAKKIATSGLSNTEKIEQLGLAMFGEDWKS